MSALTLAESARNIREALKDKRYRATPLGLDVARYVRWKRNEWGAQPETIRDYEAVLAKLALFFADLELADLNPPVGTERLRECWDHHWGERSPRTRAKVRSIWVDFFDWAGRERGLHGNPARALASPKKRDVKRDPFTGEFVEKVVAAQTYLADRIACRLILEYALRRAELAGVQLKHFDFERKRLVVTGKGAKVRLVPIISDQLWRELATLQLEERLAGDNYLLYRTDTREMRCSEEEAESTLRLPGEILYYRSRTRRHHDRGLTPRSVHGWWIRCVERAGLDPTGMNMHRGRHTVASEILRGSGNIVAAQKMLGHESIETTVRAYAKFDDSDLERVLREVRAEKE